MQALVYSFILLSSLSIGALAYFGLTFTPIESFLCALAALAVMVVAMERRLRKRSEARLERAIEDLSRLLSTDAQAGQVLSQRLNAIADVDAGPRIEVLEADVSVLGTVIRQVAEAVAELEESVAAGVLKPGRRGGRTEDAAPADPGGMDSLLDDDDGPEMPVEEPIVPIEDVQRAISKDSLVVHSRAIISLPQRRRFGYDLVPRIPMPDGFADPPDFMPRQGNEALVRAIEMKCFFVALTMARRGYVLGENFVIQTPLSSATLMDLDSVETIISHLDEDRTVSRFMIFRIAQGNFDGLDNASGAGLNAILDKGVSICLDNARTLRVDFSALSEKGVSGVRLDAERFIANSSQFTDYHSSDVAPYVKRFGVDLILTGVRTEQHILSLIEDGVKLAVGPHAGALGPVRAELMEIGATEKAAAASGRN